MSNIQWTDITSNPIHLVRPDGSHGGHWCKKISPGCANCYAEAQNNNKFFSFASGLPYTGNAPENLILDEKVLQEWLKIKQPQKIFVCSMTDMFAEWVSDEWLDRIFAYMCIAHWHTYQILTKRADRLPKYFTLESASRVSRLAHQLLKDGVAGKERQDYVNKRCIITNINEFWPRHNIWIGVSVEDQKSNDERIPYLLETPAAVRFLSCEPLLEWIKLTLSAKILNPDTPHLWSKEDDSGTITREINWVIVGGESGSNARNTYIDHLRSVVHQCQEANIKVLVKQVGAKPVAHWDKENEILTMHRISDRKGGILEEFPPDLQIRQFPTFNQ
ncbi:DUF5131 family protein [Anabaena azotica]|uniref:DUF5131 family protein n=1 Tax=Anabaena azotica FACHB-119 TaxID=947527 RepID=A0ABR8D108_9NOST|nr:DUF5131 family protein [Anabaena azotica]MBD2499881.1 DUF5131 family protein [Anabaena azotica FACHB-119]